MDTNPKPTRKAYWHEYYKTHRKEFSKRSRAYYLANRDRILAKKRKEREAKKNDPRTTLDHTMGTQETVCGGVPKEQQSQDRSIE